MVSALQQKYLLVTLSAQVMLSIINTLFILSDLGVVLALLGFWGLVQGSVPVLLFFAVSQSLSIAMDVVRLVLWGPFILSNILQVRCPFGRCVLADAMGDSDSRHTGHILPSADGVWHHG